MTYYFLNEKKVKNNIISKSNIYIYRYELTTKKFVKHILHTTNTSSIKKLYKQILNKNHKRREEQKTYIYTYIYIHIYKTSVYIYVKQYRLYQILF